MGILLAGAAAYLLALARERGGHSVIESLTASFAAPAWTGGVPGLTVAELVGSGVATSALFAVAREQGHRLDPVSACGYPIAVPLEVRDSYGLVPPRPVVRQQVELTDPWLDPVRERIGREPWIARVPILHGDELLGLLILAHPQPGLISDPAFLRPLGSLLAVALSGADGFGAARPAGVTSQDWGRHEMIEATASEFGPALIAVEAFASAVAGDAETVGTIEDARRLSTLALSVERLGVIMSDLSTLGAGAEALVVGDAESIDLTPVLDAAVDALEPAFSAREQALTLELMSEQLTAFVSPDAVERLLLHLLSNANRAAPDGGAVAVRAESADGVVRIEVEDSSVAPHADQLQRALEAFHRVPQDAGDVPGAGLGLALARRLAESQRGSLDARQSPTGGALYVAELPTEPAPGPPPLPEPAEDEDETAAGPARQLFDEDDGDLAGAEVDDRDSLDDGDLELDELDEDGLDDDGWLDDEPDGPHEAAGGRGPHPDR